MFSAGSTSRHFSSSTNCPLPCRGAYLPLRPDACELFAAGASGDTPAGSLVMSVRAKEMLGSIKDALRQLAQQGDASGGGYTFSGGSLLSGFTNSSDEEDEDMEDDDGNRERQGPVDDSEQVGEVSFDDADMDYR